MPLYIRDDGVKALAHEVAALQGSTVTDAVRQSLERRRDQLLTAITERRARIQDMLARFDAEPDMAPGFTDKDLHDENGDPVA